MTPVGEMMVNESSLDLRRFDISEVKTTRSDTTCFELIHTNPAKLPGLRR